MKHGMVVGSCLFALGLASSQTARAQTGVTELNSSVMLVGDWDWRPTHDGTSRCLEMVERAARLGNGTLNFVPTHYAWSYEQQGIHDDAGRPTWRATGYCFRRDEHGCRSFAPDESAPSGQQWRIKNDWQTCFEAALKAGMNLSVVPHLDDASRMGAWRNNLFFGATEQLGSEHAYSYKEIMLDPLVVAIAQAIESQQAHDVDVWFALQGEMGATIFHDPWSYVDAAADLRRKLSYVAQRYGTRVHIGVSMNYNNVGGGARRIDWGGVEALFESVDFVGLSSYGRLDEQPSADNLDRTIRGFAGELSGYGIDLAALMGRGTELHFSELGIGGGVNGAGTERADEPWEFAAYPYYGMYGEYHPSLDPFLSDVGRDFRQSFYAATVDFLSRPKQRASVGWGNWFVDRAFLWNLDSWDVQAVYPTSRSQHGSYRSERTMCLLYHHNLGWDGRGCLADPPRDVSVATCTNAAAQDHDGDGYGWNDFELCKVACQNPGAPRDGYGWENGRTCVAG